MAEETGIAWCDSTFNPWIGCTEVSRACDFCYARTLAQRHGWAEWGNHPRHRTSTANWLKPLAWNRKAERTGTRPRVFCASLADVFDNQVPEQWRADLWDIIDRTPNLDWLLLTKRPQNIARMMLDARRAVVGGDISDEHLTWPWNHVWLGTTCEDQPEFDKRWPILSAIPAAVRFISYEPALGPLRLNGARPDLIIFGGESGPHRREVDLQWGRDLRDECAANGVAFFGKQWDGVRSLPADLMVRQMPGERG